MALPEFIRNMKQPPRSAKHGNRKPSPKTHGSPIDGASSTDARAAAFATYQNVPIHTIPFDLSPGAINSIDSRVTPAYLKFIQDMTEQFNSLMVGINCPLSPSIPHAGIRAGEIIGWRLWSVDKSGLLRSIIRDLVFWTPGVAMKGNVGEIVCRFWGHKPDRYAGVYSFKDRERAQSEFNSGVIELKRYPTHADYNTVGLALGSVKLWGEIVEHEYGYRASFAKPASLDEIYYYGVPTTDPKGLYF